MHKIREEAAQLQKAKDELQETLDELAKEDEKKRVRQQLRQGHDRIIHHGLSSDEDENEDGSRAMRMKVKTEHADERQLQPGLYYLQQACRNLYEDVLEFRLLISEEHRQYFENISTLLRERDRLSELLAEAKTKDDKKSNVVSSLTGEIQKLQRELGEKTEQIVQLQTELSVNAQEIQDQSKDKPRAYSEHVHAMRPAHAPALPAGWQQKMSASKGKAYYLHTETGRTTWVHPEKAVPAPLPEQIGDVMRMQQQDDLNERLRVSHEMHQLSKAECGRLALELQAVRHENGLLKAAVEELSITSEKLEEFAKTQHQDRCRLGNELAQAKEEVATSSRKLHAFIEEIEDLKKRLAATEKERAHLEKSHVEAAWLSHAAQVESSVLRVQIEQLSKESSAVQELEECIASLLQQSEQHLTDQAEMWTQLQNHAGLHEALVEERAADALLLNKASQLAHSLKSELQVASLSVIDFVTLVVAEIVACVYVLQELVLVVESLRQALTKDSASRHTTCLNRKASQEVSLSDAPKKVLVNLSSINDANGGADEQWFTVMNASRANYTISTSTHTYTTHLHRGK
jgi:chromosome segregation ATPase